MIFEEAKSSLRFSSMQNIDPIFLLMFSLARAGG
jgi:hypothetical protein